MQEIVLTKGIPGSGKSTWARKMITQSDSWKRVNKDDLREMVDGSVWSEPNEKVILNIRDHIVMEFIRKGKNVIIDDTNFEDKHFDRMCTIARSFNKHIMVSEKYFPVDLETAIKRNELRMALHPGNKVTEAVIRHYYDKYIDGHSVHERSEVFLPREPLPEKEYKNLPEAIICDLDGTLALLDGRDPYDASTCEQDKLNRPVAELLKVMHWNKGIKIIFMSGRKGIYKEQTERFIHNHLDEVRLTPRFKNDNLPSDQIWYTDKFKFDLHMRADGDNRKDSIVKKEMYYEHIHNKYKILFVIDDRPSVVRMWRDELGLCTFQLDDKEF